MPDYSIIEQVCRKLSVTLPELMDGKDAAESSMRVYDDEQILDLLRRMQELERQKWILYGIILVVLGLACNAMSATASASRWPPCTACRFPRPRPAPQRCRSSYPVF